MQTTNINPSELCSRKLWQLVNNRENDAIDGADLERVISELAERRRYLAELTQMGKLGDSSHNL